MITALEVLAYKEASFKEALSTVVRPTSTSVAFDKKIEKKDLAHPAAIDVGIKPATVSVNRGAPTAPMAKALAG